MAEARCDKCGKTMNVSSVALLLLRSGKKVVRHGCGGRFK